MSFDIVRKYHPQAAQLFQILSFLNPDVILIDFLQSGVNALSNDLQQVVSSRIDLARALIELEKFSLLKWGRLTKTIIIHRLVQTVIRDAMSEEERMTLYVIIANLCDESFPKA